MEMNLRDSMKSECGACSGFCCVALFFAKTDGFPSNKDAGVPCQHLRDDFRCAVHDELARRGFKGCMAYDCFGAGQTVSRMYQRAWNAPSQNAEEMFQVFLAVYRLRQMMWYLLDADPRAAHGLVAENLEIAAQLPEKILVFNFAEYKARVDAVLKQACGTAGTADHIGRDFKGKNLAGKNFSMSLLIAASLKDCDLRGARFLGTDLRDANLCGADLRYSLFLTQGQVNAACGDETTQLPPWLDIPAAWRK